MALYHFHVTQIKRSKGHSAVASAAYRAGEKLHSERYGEYSDYTRKGGVIFSEILLSPQAPREYADRETLWNAVENAEKRPDAPSLPILSISHSRTNLLWRKMLTWQGDSWKKIFSPVG